MFAHITSFAPTNQTFNIHLCRRLCKWEIRGSQSDFSVGTKHLLCKVKQDLFHIGESNFLCYIEPFNLVENTVRSGSNRFITENPPRTNHPDRRSLCLHSPNLNR